MYDIFYLKTGIVITDLEKKQLLGWRERKHLRSYLVK